jgi:hypothetical protein
MFTYAAVVGVDSVAYIRAMAFTRVRTIKGKQYRYLEERWREGKKVRSRSTFLGAIGEFIAAQRLDPQDRAVACAERAAAKVEEYQRELFGETASERQAREARGLPAPALAVAAESPPGLTPGQENAPANAGATDAQAGAEAQ